MGTALFTRSSIQERHFTDVGCPHKAKGCCRGFGIEITEAEWPSHHLPHAVLADRGEFEGYNANNLVESLNIKVDNTPPYRADMKGIVEQSFNELNN
ncbi:MAG: hypothetical protein KME31_38250 [Tolypothrix carrinoi HA7290-LM1]|jgi:hypothetical protein|nr:hypothetical protein [Tolypothrix carrinoi HA7290-LM1]